MRHLRIQYLLFLLAISNHSTIWAQSSVGLRNYIFSPIAVSPSYAGRTNGELNLIYNNQWAGMDGSPQTFLLSMDFMNAYNLGTNFQIFNDQIGPIRNTSFKLSNAYHLQISDIDFFLLACNTG